ncbi:hypothetical protein FOA52_011878 [Chlamydomonas sp. UWO 241]|nr:hypothetical protein FOA52_011878 [Chlamydomonas sp. UWO 241]
MRGQAALAALLLLVGAMKVATYATVLSTTPNNDETHEQQSWAQRALAAEGANADASGQDEPQGGGGAVTAGRRALLANAPTSITASFRGVPSASGWQAVQLRWGQLMYDPDGKTLQAPSSDSTSGEGVTSTAGLSVYTGTAGVSGQWFALGLVPLTPSNNYNIYVYKSGSWNSVLSLVATTGNADGDSVGMVANTSSSPGFSSPAAQFKFVHGCVPSSTFYYIYSTLAPSLCLAGVHTSPSTYSIGVKTCAASDVTQLWQVVGTNTGTQGMTVTQNDTHSSFFNGAPCVALSLTATAAVGVLAGAAGAGAAATVAGSALAGAAGSASLGMVFVVQRFALTANVAANFSDAYRGAACGLQWANFQFGLLGDVQPPSCKYYTYSYDLVADAGGGGRRALMGGSDEDWKYEGSGGHGRRALLSYPSSDIDEVVRQAYERLLVVVIVCAGLTLAHWFALALWSSSGHTQGASLPSILVFPHLELLLGVLSVLALSQSAGALMGSGRGGPVVVGVLVLLYLLAFVSLLVLLAQYLNKVRQSSLSLDHHDADLINDNAHGRMALALKGGLADAWEDPPTPGGAKAGSGLVLVQRGGPALSGKQRSESTLRSQKVVPAGAMVAAAVSTPSHDADALRVMTRGITFVDGQPVFSDIEMEKAALRGRVERRLQEEQEEDDLKMEPYRTQLYLRQGMSLGEVYHLVTAAAAAAAEGKPAPSSPVATLAAPKQGETPPPTDADARPSPVPFWASLFGWASGPSPPPPPPASPLLQVCEFTVRRTPWWRVGP